MQVPGGGFPLVLMADRQPTGGYPKIATVIRADLPRLAQSRPGDQIRFAATDVETGVAELRRLHAAIDAAPASLRPLLARAPSAERLLAENLIGGVVDAETPSP